MRETFALIEQRTISGRGVLQIPQDAEYRHFRIWVRVFRDPDPDFVNKRYNPERSNYANINYMAQGYVARSHVMQYEQEVYELEASECCAFLIDSLACNFKAIEDVLCLILPAVGAGACVPGATDFLDAIKNPIDEIFFVCRDETALQVDLYGLKFDQTCPEGAQTPKLPAGAPTPLPDVPTGTPVEVSEPYVPPDDDGNTIPFEGDTSPSMFPFGDVCVIYTVTIQYDIPPTTGIQQSNTFFGVIEDVVFNISPSGSSASVICRGLYNPILFPVCIDPPGQNVLLFGTSGVEWQNAEVFSITPL